eukprot:TRINITY_DN646_c0_g1_i3.p1 TRINITY_DN646_c0_g1~~TRINITY_DN646_c0_g1_i3.p1  ORF type:complete len:201 (+),score=21.59 TRINITY_DN646_c0_g1_i3:430-1032(+)
MVYMGCSIVSGSGKGVVVYTGMRTHMGEVAEILKMTEDDGSPLEAKLQKLGFKLGLASLAASAIILIFGWALKLKPDPTKDLNPYMQILLLAVSLTVAAVPEGLPVCVTIALAHGMKVMSDKHSVVKKMKSVETLGSASVVCSDKTGTLTTGVMTVRRIWTPTKWQCLKVTGEGYTPEGHFFPVDGNEDEQVIGRKMVLS